MGKLKHAVFLKTTTTKKINDLVLVQVRRLFTQALYLSRNSSESYRARFSLDSTVECLVCCVKCVIDVLQAKKKKKYISHGYVAVLSHWLLSIDAVHCSAISINLTMKIWGITFDQSGPRLKSMIQEKENVKIEGDKHVNGSEIDFFCLVLPITSFSWVSVSEVGCFMRLVKLNS